MPKLEQNVFFVSNDDKKDQPEQPKTFNPVLLIWLAILAAIIGLVMSQSGEITSSQKP